MTKRYSYFKSELTDLFVISDELHKETFSVVDDEYNCSRIVRKLNTLTDENEQLRKENDMFSCELSVSANKEISRNCRIAELEEENEQLKSTIKEVIELLSEEVDLFTDKATEYDINAYIELKELDNKDAFYMAIATKKAIKMLKELK